ncbi:lipase family protein [Nocardioides marmoriginsengisoli]|nr:lipase family protein [Nocardioides marmoriginsengisoli]
MSPSARIRTVAVLALIGVVVAVLVLLTRPKSDDPGERPVVDFYAAPAELPSKPGTLIRSEEAFGALPDDTRAWRILYTTTRDKGEPAVASALVIAKSGVEGERPVLAWAHGTTGVAQDCAPSVQMDQLTFGAIADLDNVVEQGWVVVATDYVGLGTRGPHPYLIGQGEGRSVLDSVRAARQFSEVSLQSKTVVWGHSQGGHAALWAGILAPTYAKDVDVVGVAGIAPATNLGALARNLASAPGGVVFGAYLIASYSAAYPSLDFEDYVRVAALEPLREMADHCISDTQPLIDLAQSPALAKNYYSRDPDSGSLGARLAENSPTGKIDAPVLIAQGTTDALVLPATQDAYVAQRCASGSGGPLDYRTYKKLGHVTIIAPESPMLSDLLAWTKARFAGKAAPSTCR